MPGNGLGDITLKNFNPHSKYALIRVSSTLAERWLGNGLIPAGRQMLSVCKLLIGANTKPPDTSARSIRIQGMVTSIKPELHFWKVLEGTAERYSLILSEMINPI